MIENHQNKMLPEIPDPDEVRRQLAIALTAADLLKQQLRVSARAAQERERLARLQRADGDE